MRKIYKEDKNKKIFYNLGKKGCCLTKNASSQMLDGTVKLVF